MSQHLLSSLQEVVRVHEKWRVGNSAATMSAVVAIPTDQKKHLLSIAEVVQLAVRYQQSEAPQGELSPQVSLERSREVAVVDSIKKVSLGVCDLYDTGVLKLGEITPSLLDKIGRSRDENLHSDFIAALLDPRVCGEFAKAFLQSLLRWVSDDHSFTADAFYRVTRERPLYTFAPGLMGTEISNRQVDILVEHPDFAVLIENKIDSAESEMQTEDYHTAMIEGPGKGGQRRIFEILLAPDSREPGSSHFKLLQYRELCAVLAIALDSSAGHPVAEKMARFYYAELYHQFVKTRADAAIAVREFWRKK